MRKEIGETNVSKKNVVKVNTNFFVLLCLSSKIRISNAERPAANQALRAPVQRISEAVRMIAGR